MPEPIVLCSSGGKDSLLALYELGRQSCYEVVALLTTVNEEFDRVSMHGVRRGLLHQQATSLGLPLDEVTIARGANNQNYEAAMSAAFARYSERGIRTIAFGDIFLEELREYRKQHLARHKLQGVFPLWQQDSRELVARFVKLGFRAVTVCIDPKRLDEGFLGRTIDEAFVADLPAHVDPCGENGEFHSFVWDGPNLHESVPCVLGERVRRDSFLFCDLLSECDRNHADASRESGAVRQPL